MSIFCSQCGQSLPDGVKFCASCGNKIVYTAPVMPEPVAQMPMPEPVEQMPMPEPVAQMPMPEPVAQMPMPEPVVQMPMPAVAPVPVVMPTPVQAPAQKEAKQHKDIRGLRITFSVILSILAAVLFISYFSVNMVMTIISPKNISGVIHDMDLLNKDMGNLFSDVDYTYGNKVETFSEAIAYTLRVELERASGVVIPAEVAEKLANSKQFNTDAEKFIEDIITYISEGELTAKRFAEGLTDILENNIKTVSKELGYELPSYVMINLKSNIQYDESVIRFADEMNDTVGKYLGIFYKFVPKFVLYIILALAVICCIGVMLLNMFKLETGFRAVGIATLVSGIFGVLVSGGITVFSFFATKVFGPLFVQYTSVIKQMNEIIRGIASRITIATIIPPACVLVVGIAFMIVQGRMAKIRKRRIRG